LADTAGLSYSANCGGWDRNSSGTFLFPTTANPNVGDTADNGVFFDSASYDRNGVKGPNSRVGAMKDGAGTTIMFAENIHKTYFSPSNAPLFSWLSGSEELGSTPYPSEQQLGIVWVVPTQGTAPQPGNTINNQERIGGNDAQLVDFDPSKPRFARPASAHGSGANVGFCDGHSQYLRDDIDYIVYVQLMTPNGRKCEDAASHRGQNTQALSSSDPIKAYRIAPPLADKDYN
jgi:prepilin-type processing-associated H-X9-DG protein